MANTEQSSPLLIVLQFKCEVGEKFGELRGCHREMASYMVDENGIITRKLGPDGLAVDFPQDDLQKYLGDSFATFNAQLEQAVADKEASEQRRQTETDALNESLTAANAQIKNLTAQANSQISDLANKLALANMQLNAAQAVVQQPAETTASDGLQ